MTHPELPTHEEIRRAAERARDILDGRTNAVLWVRRVSETEPARLMVLPEDQQAPPPYVCVRRDICREGRAWLAGGGRNGQR